MVGSRHFDTNKTPSSSSTLHVMLGVHQIRRSLPIGRGTAVMAHEQVSALFGFRCYELLSVSRVIIRNTGFEGAIR